MYTEKQIKGYAKALRKALSVRNLELSHAQSLELIAETIGEKSWNHLSAKISSDEGREVPEGWFVVGHGRRHKAINFIKDDNGTSLHINGALAEKNEFLSITQTIDAKNYLGGNVKMTARVKTQDVEFASLWIRVDGENGRRSLSFDNMYSQPPIRALQGTNDWSEIELVLDVPDGAETINFGCMVRGPGSAEFKDLGFFAVGKEVPLSAGKRPDGPQNLSFD